MTDYSSRIAREDATEDAEIKQHKAHLRRALIAARNALSQDTRAAANTAIGQHLLDWCQAHRYASLAVYWPIRGEPDLRPIYPALVNAGLQLSLPIVVAADQPLTFAAWTPGQPMVLDRADIPTPAQPQREVIPAAILLPCVGINSQQIRLGYGGGFYDRTLAALPSAVAIGIAFECARGDFTAAVHDLPVHHVITERGSV
jgi:5-formyltetrahydrofolate cyclo-ligase